MSKQGLRHWSGSRSAKFVDVRPAILCPAHLTGPDDVVGEGREVFGPAPPGS